MGDCASNTVGNLTADLGGQVIATNPAGTGFVDVRDGALVVNNGTLRVDQLVMTNTCGAFAHISGTVVAGKVVLDPNAFRIKSVLRQGNDVLVTWLMGPGISNFLQVATGRPNGSYSTNGFTNLFVVINNFFPGTITNFLDVGGATNRPARYYRARLVP